MYISDLTRVEIGSDTTSLLVRPYTMFFVDEIPDNHYVCLEIGNSLIAFTDIFTKIRLHEKQNVVFPQPDENVFKEFFEVSFFKNDVTIYPTKFHDVKLFIRSKDDPKQIQQISFYVYIRDDTYESIVQYQDCMQGSDMYIPVDRLNARGYIGCNNVIRFMSGMAGLGFRSY